MRPVSGSSATPNALAPITLMKSSVAAKLGFASTCESKNAWRSLAAFSTGSVTNFGPSLTLDKTATVRRGEDYLARILQFARLADDVALRIFGIGDTDHAHLFHLV